MVRVMSDFSNLPTGPSRPDARPAGRIDRRPQPGAADQAPGAPAERGAESRAGRRDPFDLETAFARLKTLLAFDGVNGPRSNVPRRGFYLNILT